MSTAATPVPALGHAVTALLAVAAGLAVANVYYAQPLLNAIARDLKVGEDVIGAVIMVTQIGYGFGLLLIAPLGDLIDRRKQIVTQMVLTAAMLAAAGLAHGSTGFLLAMAATGLLAVVAQLIVAHGAALALPEERGRTVGTITTGIVLGILLARTIAGSVADLAGWRYVYLCSAAATLGVAALLIAVLPPATAQPVRMSYGRLVATLFTLYRTLPILRARAVLAFLIFFTITVLQTPLALMLTATPHRLSQTQVGLFGLAGAAGALGASLSGRFTDRGKAQAITGIGLALMLAAWMPIALLPYSLWALIFGIVVIDFGLQSVHVANQGLIYRERPDAQTRLAAGYMVFYSLGSAAGSILSTLVYAQFGWAGVCILGASGSATAIAFWAATASISHHISARPVPAATTTERSGWRRPFI